MVKWKAMSPGEKIFRIFNTLFLCLIMVIMVYPFWYVLVCSFSSLSHIQNTTFILWPDGIHLEAYQQVFRNELVPTAYLNTIFITIVGTAISILLTIIGAFCLSRRGLPGHTAMTAFVVFTMLFNGGLIPTYLLVRELKMINTLWSVIVPCAINTYNMIIMRNFFSAVPQELEEAATIDGASQRQYLLRILLPLSGASIATITLFYAVDYWNAYFYSLIYITKRQLLPMQAILRQVLMTTEIETLMYDAAVQTLPSEMLKDAMIVVTALPIICLYPFIQRYFVKGVMVGSLKG
ncbi:MAG: carbohydrate ABC transporter permease [Clostridia bacterium]|nr:carbohydrate ABC transporter permease [Clostridia bacterium]